MSGVLYLARDLYSFGGIQRYSRFQLGGVQRLLPNSEIRVCSLAGPSSHGFPPSIDVSIIGGTGIVSKLLFVTRVLASAMRQRPSLVICDHINLAPLAHLIKRLTSCRVCLNCYAIEVWGRLPRRRLWALLAADRVVSDCDFTRRLLESRYRTIEGRIDVVPDPVEPDRFSPGTANVSGLADLSGPVVLTVSRLVRGRSKGHEHMFEALARLPEIECAYLIAGDGSDRARLERRAAELGVDNRVRFLGLVAEEDLPSLYRACDLFVLVSAFDLQEPLQGEGVPLVVVEAQATGKPVITSSADGSAESIRDGVTGILVDPHDIDALVRSLKRLLTDAELRQRMGVAAREFAVEQFAFETFALRIASVIHSLGVNGELAA